MGVGCCCCFCFCFGLLLFGIRVLRTRLTGLYQQLDDLETYLVKEVEIEEIPLRNAQSQLAVRNCFKNSFCTRKGRKTAPLPICCQNRSFSSSLNLQERLRSKEEAMVSYRNDYHLLISKILILAIAMN